MRVPQRRSEILQSTKKISDNYLTKEKIKKLQSELQDLEKNQRLAAANEVRRLAELGDFSENAAYQIAKWRLRQINSRITSLQERIKNAIPIETPTSGKIAIGSTVTVETTGRQFTYQILGSQETNPSRGQISHLSPIGMALLGHREGDLITVKIQSKNVEYRILEIK